MDTISENPFRPSFFRVETSEGLGMYNSKGNSLFASDSFISSESRHPIPKNDSLLEDNFAKITRRDLARGNFDDYSFGFVNLSQFRQWLYDDQTLKDLHSFGFRLVEYSGRVVAGNTQAMILTKEKEMVKTYSLLNFVCEVTNLS